MGCVFIAPDILLKTREILKILCAKCFTNLLIKPNQHSTKNNSFFMETNNHLQNFQSPAIPHCEDASKSAKFSCDDCGRTYKYSSGLWKHKKYDCNKRPQFACSYCPKSFTRKESLLLHSRSVHYKDPIITRAPE